MNICLVMIQISYTLNSKFPIMQVIKPTLPLLERKGPFLYIKVPEILFSRQSEL